MFSQPIAEKCPEILGSNPTEQKNCSFRITLTSTLKSLSNEIFKVCRLNGSSMRHLTRSFIFCLSIEIQTMLFAICCLEIQSFNLTISLGFFLLIFRTIESTLSICSLDLLFPLFSLLMTNECCFFIFMKKILRATKTKQKEKRSFELFFLFCFNFLL